MPCSDLHLDRNTCSLTALALSPSVLFHVILLLVKIISTWLPRKWQTLVLCSRNTSLAFNCQRIECQDCTKCNKETDTSAERGCTTDTVHPVTHYSVRVCSMPDLVQCGREHLCQPWQERQQQRVLGNLWMSHKQRPQTEGEAAQRLQQCTSTEVDSVNSLAFKLRNSM